MDNEMSRKRSEYEDEIDLVELFSVLLSKAWLIVLTAVVFAVISGVYTRFFVTPLYRSTTSIYVLNRQNESTLTSSDLSASTYLTLDYAELIKSRTVAEDVISSLGLSNISPEGLLGRISVSTKNNTRIITISILDPDPQMAQKIANSVRVNASKQIQKVTNSEAVNVVDTANLPTRQYSPSLTKNVTLAFLIGAVLSSGFIILSHIMNDTIRSDEDLEKYLGVTAIGIIPMDKNEAVSSRKKNNKNRRKKG